MSSMWFLGVVKSLPFKENEISNLIKTLSKRCYIEKISYIDKGQQVEKNLDRKFSQLEVADLIKKYCLNGSIFIHFYIQEGKLKYDGFLSIKNNKEYIIIDIVYDYLLDNRENLLKKVITLAESIYKSVNGFYAYVTWEFGPISMKGLENYEEFKKIFSGYRKTRKSTFDIKTFKKVVEEYFKIKLD